MAVRTTEELVGGIVEVDSTIPIDPFIQAANLIVNRIVAVAKDGTGALYYTDEDELEMIERWLAAHFYCIRDPQRVVEGVVSLITRFESRIGLHLDVTRHGQQAMLLDTSGALAEYNRTLAKGPIRRRVSVLWLGQEPTPSGEPNE